MQIDGIDEHPQAEHRYKRGDHAPGQQRLAAALQRKQHLQDSWLALSAFFTFAIMLSLMVFMFEGVRDASGVRMPIVHDIEREAILRTLEMVGGSTSRAAEAGPGGAGRSSSTSCRLRSAAAFWITPTRRPSTKFGRRACSRPSSASFVRGALRSGSTAFDGTSIQ